jgi:hypothetical protein
MNRIHFLIICSSLITANSVFSQVQDSVAIPVDSVTAAVITVADSLPNHDSLIVAKPKKEPFLYRVFVKNYPNPDMALYLALAVPGAGQMYNKRWWKLPIVYAAYGGLVASIDFNTKRYKLFRDSYIAELKGKEHPYSGTRYSADDLRRIRDVYDKNRQLSYIGMVAVHLLQATEAFVDSHLRTFDISDDLSLKVAPTIQTHLNSPAAGVGVFLTLK